jgi:hypothetical protein
MCTVEDYRATCGERTWNSGMKFANKLKEKEIKIAFFSSTPQGGGVALMRHALVRFARTMGVKLDWVSPRNSPIPLFSDQKIVCPEAQTRSIQNHEECSQHSPRGCRPGFMDFLRGQEESCGLDQG